MTDQDFTLLKIRHFTADDVRATGAQLMDVDLRLLCALDRFADQAQRAIVLLHNGLTTGEHMSDTHRAGLAADIAFHDDEGVLDISSLVIIAANCGFRGIGVYWNQAAYSMHLDLRQRPGQWARWRRHRETVWHETALIVDPRTLVP